MRPRRQYHIHSTLLIYAFVSLLIAVGAFTSQNNLLFWCFGLAIGLMFTSGIISGTMMMRVRVRREPVQDCQAGQALPVRYAVTNAGRWLPVFALTIREDMPVVSAAEQSLEAHAHIDAPPTAFVAHVPPGKTVIVEAPAAALSRGRVRLDRFTVITAFPFGIVRKSLRYQQPASAIVRPRRAQAPELGAGVSRGKTPAEEARSRGAAAGQEFIALREYRPGDNPRLIAWKASARLGDSAGSLIAPFLVRQTASHSPGRIHIVLDLPAQADEASREQAIAVAAGAIAGATQQGMMIALTVPVHRLHSGLRAGAAHAESLLLQLALLPRQPDPATLSSRAAMMRIAPGEPCLVVHAGCADATIGPSWASRAATNAPGMEAAA